MGLTFEHPWSLFLSLLAIPIAYMALRSVPLLGATRAWGGLAIRLAVLLLLTMAIAQPSWLHMSHSVSLIVVADTSASVPEEKMAGAIAKVSEAIARSRQPGDRVGLVATAASPVILQLPTADAGLPEIQAASRRDATNLAAGVQMALATKPGDTNARILLISDGNQTAGSLQDAAQRASAVGVPIDVIPIEYEHRDEALVESVLAPVRARPGQSVDLRVVIRAQQAMEGRVTVWQNDQPLVLGESGEHAHPVSLDPGPNMIRIPVVPGMAGAQRFRVRFEPAPPRADTIEENNVGETVVFVGGTARVLLVQGEGSMEGDAIERILRRGEIQVVSQTPETASLGGLTELSGYDAVILANVPRWLVSNEFDRALHTYVHDLGGGLVMLGGPESFGAGGWLGSVTAQALPLKLDPPQTRQLMKTALAIVLDNSGSMGGSVGNSTAAKLDVACQGASAATRVLTRLDEVAVIAFNGQTEIVAPMQRLGDGNGVRERIEQIGLGGGTVMLPALQAAREQLRLSRAGAKHVVLLTDGQSVDDPGDLLDAIVRLRREGATLSTIMVGDDANRMLLRRMAAAGNGRGYEVAVNKAAVELPQVFIREAIVSARSLIVEGEFAASVSAAQAGPLAGIPQLPRVRGYVLCVPRDGPSQIAASVRGEEGPDPLLAYWNYGVGRSVAFTSDVTPRWAPEWCAWDGLQKLWEQTIRWSLRPAMPQSVQISTSMDGDRARVQVSDADPAHGGGTQVAGLLVPPGGTAAHLPLRQVGSGMWTGEFDLGSAGAYLVDVAFSAEGDGSRARGGSVQAVVSLPYPAEFRALHDDASLLGDAARRTGGRVLSLSDTGPWDLFERSGLLAVRSSRQFWDAMTVLAAVLLLADVCWRRLAIGREDLREIPALIGAGLHAASSSERLASLKLAKERAQERTGKSEREPNSES